MRTKEYKAVAYEYTHGCKGYYIGEGIVFSNSPKKAIDEAKELAYQALHKEEATANDAGTPILATAQVWKRGKEIINKSY
tara:strand:+ start:454 stop:693 length:240 start_codon:yes stop_codon:yes gene_type:complete